MTDIKMKVFRGEEGEGEEEQHLDRARRTGRRHLDRGPQHGARRQQEAVFGER